MDEAIPTPTILTLSMFLNDLTDSCCPGQLFKSTI
jgi:hypothetical protein